jgi:membrane protein DedA with SNARE-associated domain
MTFQNSPTCREIFSPFLDSFYAAKGNSIRKKRMVTTRSSSSSLSKARARSPPLSLSTCIFLISFVNVVGKIADVMILVLGQMPTLLLLLNANDVNLTIASAANMPFYSFIIIGIFRRVLEDCLYFFSGRWYGREVVDYLTKRRGLKAKVRESERLMRKYGAGIILVFPGALTCFAYGMAKRGSRRRTFLFLDSLGAAMRVVLFRLCGKGAKKVLGLSVVRWALGVVMKYKEIAMTVGGTALAVGGAGAYYYFY